MWTFLKNPTPTRGLVIDTARRIVRQQPSFINGLADTSSDAPPFHITHLESTPIWQCTACMALQQLSVCGYESQCKSRLAVAASSKLPCAALARSMMYKILVETVAKTLGQTTSLRDAFHHPSITCFTHEENPHASAPSSSGSRPSKHRDHR